MSENVATLKTEPIWLKTKTDENEPLSVCFLPEKGMNFISYCKGDIEIIAQSTKNLFIERNAGLGAMIGPHFHHRNPKVIPKFPDLSLFPHLAGLKAKGVLEPFSHGIGRYVSWTVETVRADYIKATLRGDDKWKGVSLKELEGQNFYMSYVAHLRPSGLEIQLAVVSDTESVVGLHTYYALHDQQGLVRAQVKNSYRDQDQLKSLENSTWNYSKDHVLVFDLENSADYGFFPDPDPTAGEIFLETGQKRVSVRYNTANAENSWQLWHPKGESFVCIEPLSAKDPKKPQLSVSSLKILISIL